MEFDTSSKVVCAAELKKEDRDTAPGRLLDLMILVLAFAAVDLSDKADSKEGKEFLSKGASLYKMHRSSLEEGAKRHLESLMERSDSGSIKSQYRLMEQISPTRKSKFVEEFMVWLKMRSTLMRDVFPGRVYSNAVKVASACEETDPGVRLQKLACVPTSSGLSAMFKWVRTGADVLGNPPPSAQALAAQVEGAVTVAEELREVERKLNVEPPGTEARIALEDERLDRSAEVLEAVEESDDPGTITSAVTTKLATPSRIAQKFGLTPEQEDVMRSMGKVCVAAGAGSGKSTTLVATIAHLIEEKGYSPNQIMACSFTVAASSELESRVVERAGIHGVRIGTIHSIAREIILQAKPNLRQAVSATKNADKLFKMAMKQITLSEAAYSEAQDKLKGTLERIEGVPNWSSADILKSFHDQLSRGRALSEKQLSVLDKYESGEWKARPRRYASEAVLAIRAAIKESSSKNPIQSEFEVTAAEGQEDKISPYWTTPVGQWFNLGVENLLGPDGKPMGEKRARLMVENFKNSGTTVEQLRADKGDTADVALYGAYEWLKKNDPVLAPAMDFTDQIIVAHDLLKNDPKVREAQQRRFKVILVDESQDQNETQFSLFRLLGERADLLGFVGDDRQSIYGFRGAKPSNYVDLTKDPEFTTKLMTMNFRSGKAIVDAANKLIAHNEDRQIPMVCNADVERKGMGAIRTREADSHESAADQVAQEIKDSVDAGDSPKDFGILVRNNAEYDAYTLALLVRGIPYRLLKKSEGGYFGKPLVRSLSAWMRLVVRGSNDEMNQAVLDAHMTPGFGLDQKFASNLAKVARGNYLDYILAGKPVYDGRSSWLNKRVGEYADTIRSISAAGGMDSPSLIRSILGIKGAKGTFEQALLKLVDEDDIIEEEGAEAGEEALRNAAMAPLRPLMLMAENFKDPGNLLGFIGKMKAANEKAQKNSPDDKEDWKEPAVLVGTVHGWKGLQAKHCFVCMAGGIFPNAKTEEKSQETGDNTVFDEDRRLAYVAITRGEETVTVMAPQKNYLGKEAGTSRFIYEACIPVVGEKEQSEIPTDQLEEKLVETEAGQKKESSQKLQQDSHSFSKSLIRYAFSLQAFDECSEECSGECSGDCSGDCAGDCSEGAMGFVGEQATCPCKSV